MASPMLALLHQRYQWLDERYQQWWFRYGQKALRSGHMVPGLRRLRERSVPDRDIAPGVMVVQKDAERDPGFRSWPLVWTRKWAAELQKRVIVDGQACVQGPAFPQVEAL